jgi:predicted metalloprotease
MSETMHVLPGFAYYDDGRSMNAYATSLRRLANSDGTVLLGTNLLFSVMSELEQPDVAVTAICAHEFGHIVQFKNNLISKIGAGQKTVRHLELHADFLAGFYAGRRKLQNRHYPAAVFAMRAYQTGDYDRRNPNHHGEPSERAAAVVRGFEAAYRTRLTIAEAIRVGLDYVARI